MSESERKHSWRSICIFVPGVLKSAMVDQVKLQGVSMNDLVLKILRDRYWWIPIKFSGRHPAGLPSREAGPVVIKVPPRIKKALVEEAVRRETNLTDLILRILAGALTVPLDLEAPKRTTPFGGGRRAA